MPFRLHAFESFVSLVQKLASPSEMGALLEETENMVRWLFLLFILLNNQELRGQCRALKAHIRVWDSLTLETKAVVGVGDFERGVACLAFSKGDGGQRLGAVDEGLEHSLSGWDWHRAHKLAEAKAANEQV